jgi:hypothetical protein
MGGYLQDVYLYKYVFLDLFHHPHQIPMGG